MLSLESHFLITYTYVGQQHTTLDPLSNREYTCFKQHEQIKCKKKDECSIIIEPGVNI